MPGTIFFKDLRRSDGFDHVFQRCLIFKKDDTAALNPLFHLAITLPDGERFFLPPGDLVNDMDPLRPFVIPQDVASPVQVVVNVSSPDPIGHDNRTSCPVFLVADGETLTFDGENYSIVPPAPTPTTGSTKPGCMVIPVSMVGLSLGLVAIQLLSQ